MANNWRTNPAIVRAKAACHAANAKAAILITFDEAGNFTVASYGVTGPICKAAGISADSIGDYLGTGEIDTDSLLAKLQEEEANDEQS